MDSQTLEDFQQKWEAVAAAEPSQTSGGRSEKAQRQQRLSLACTLAREYLALGLPPPPSTAALTGKDLLRLAAQAIVYRHDERLLAAAALLVLLYASERVAGHHRRYNASENFLNDLLS